MAKTSDNRTRFLWPLLLGWVVLAVVTVMWSLPNAEDELTADATAALQAVGIGATVEFDGRDATLSGNYTGAEQERALDAVRAVTGVRQADWATQTAAPTSTIPSSTTTTSGATSTSGPAGSTSTSGPTTIAPGSNPPTLTATLSRGALTLSGAVPSAEVAAQVAGVADLVYGPFVTDNLEVDDSVAGAGWVANAPNLMAFLPIVGEAELTVVGNEATLTGAAGSAEKKAQLEAALGAALGSDVTLTSSIEVTGKTPPLYVAEATGDGTVTITGAMPDQAAIDLIAAAAVDAYGADNVTNTMTIGTDIDSSFSIYRIPLTFAQFRPISEWTLRIENDVISGTIRGGATFDFGSAELTPELRALLDTGAGILLRNPSILMTIEGHTDSVGSDAFNLALSNARAQAGVDYLTALGVQPARLFPVGYGETRPIADNGTTAGRAENRRLEFVLGPPS
ncbi:MAG: OmpA family protein [Acidimicrobiia bacterium]|nr:OmpA family protein [Acidimicrobiia bacterium]